MATVAGGGGGGASRPRKVTIDNGPVGSPPKGQAVNRTNPPVKAKAAPGAKTRTVTPKTVQRSVSMPRTPMPPTPIRRTKR